MTRRENLFFPFRLTPSYGCGPFRIYSYMTVCVDATISNFPSWLQTIIGIFTSGSFIIILLVLLSYVSVYIDIWLSLSLSPLKIVVVIVQNTTCVQNQWMFFNRLIIYYTSSKSGARAKMIVMLKEQMIMVRVLFMIYISEENHKTS